MSINPEKDIDYFLAVFSTTEQTLPTSDAIAAEIVTEAELIPIPYSEEDEEGGS